MCLKNIHSEFIAFSQTASYQGCRMIEAIIEHLQEISKQNECCSQDDEDDNEDEIPEGFITLNEFYEHTAICSRNLSAKILNNITHTPMVAVYRKHRWNVDKDRFAIFIADQWADYPIAGSRALKYLKNSCA